MRVIALPTLSATAVVPCTIRAGPLRLIDEQVADWRADVPNALTCGRVLAVPVLAAAFYSRQASGARLPAIIFAACALTDWLDGYLARRWEVNSAFGAFLDPVADKLLVCTCLILLSGSLGAVVALPTAIIVCREVAVSALREWMGVRGHGAAVAVGWWGKVKTAAQMVALLLLMIARPGMDICVRKGGLVLLYLAAALTFSSAIGYASAAWPLLRGGQQ